MKLVNHAIVTQLDLNGLNVIQMDSVRATLAFMVQNVINVDQDILDSQKLDAGICLFLPPKFVA